MTDQPTFSDDELSLVLDGDADAGLLARVEADPDAQARLEQLRRTTDALHASSVPPLGDDVVDELIATAIDAPVAPARPVRSRRGRATPWLVAASVIILMAAGLSLVWAGRGADDDQADASRGSADTAAEVAPESSAGSSFGAADDRSAAGGSAIPPGGHGAATTVVAQEGSSAADLPLVALGSYTSGAELRRATASSFADAAKVADATSTAKGSAGDPVRGRTAPPPDAAIDRCAQQLQVTLSMKAGPTAAGYATVDGKDVLVYEFATTSARDGRDTTLVAAVGEDACDQVVFFER